MAITAPRYNPSGVHVGSMPTPMVKADTSTASALQTVGDTIASLGKSAEYAKDVRDQRDKAKKQADETIGAQAAMEWQSRNEARLAEFKTNAFGEKVYGGYDSITKAVEADTGDDLLKDKSEGARAEFNRRMVMSRRDIQAAAKQHMSIQHRAFTLDVAGKEIEMSAGKAANALARSSAAMTEADWATDRIAYQKYMAQAGTAAKRVSSVTGMPVDADGLVTAVNKESLRILEAENPHQAVKFYNQTKGQFGRFEDDAARMVAGAQDKVWVADTGKALTAKHTDKNTGLVDWAAVDTDAMTTDGVTDERAAALAQKVNQAKAQEDKRRNQAGQQAIAMAQEAVQKGKTDLNNLLKKKDYLLFKSIAMPQQLDAILGAEQNTTSMKDKIDLEISLIGPRHLQDRIIKELQDNFSNRVLSVEDRIGFTKKAKDLVEGRGDKLRQRIADLYRDMLGREKGLRQGQYTMGEDGLGKASQAEREAFLDRVDKVYDNFQRSSSLDPKNDADIQNVLNNSRVMAEVPKGGVFGGGVGYVPVIDYYDPANPPSQQRKDAADIKPEDDYPTMGAKLMAYDRAQAKKAAVEAQAAEVAAEQAAAAFQAEMRDPVKATLYQKAGTEAWVNSNPWLSQSQKDAMNAKNAAYYQEFIDRAKARP